MRNPLHCPHAYRVPQGKTEEEIKRQLGGSISGEHGTVIGKINEEG